MAKRSKESAVRLFRRLRARFKKDLGLDTLTGAERVLIDQCALLALQARQMRDAILDGEQIDNDDVVRTMNAAIRAMKLLGDRGKERAAAKAPITLEEYLEDEE